MFNPTVDLRSTCYCRCSCGNCPQATGTESLCSDGRCAPECFNRRFARAPTAGVPAALLALANEAWDAAGAPSSPAEVYWANPKYLEADGRLTGHQYRRWQDGRWLGPLEPDHLAVRTEVREVRVPDPGGRTETVWTVRVRSVRRTDGQEVARHEEISHAEWEIGRDVCGYCGAN